MEEARDFYYKAYLQNPNNYKVLKGLVLSSEQLGQTEEAEKWMQKIMEQGKQTSKDIYLFSELLKSNNKLDESEEWFNKFAELNPNDGKIKEGKSYFQQLKTLQSSSYYTTYPVSINTSDSDMGLFEFGNGVVFSSGGIKKSTLRGEPENWSDLDLFFSEKVDSVRFENITAFAPKLNTPFNDGPVTFDRANNKLYITRYAPHKANNEEGELFYHMQVVIAVQRNKEWQFEEEFFFNNQNYSVAHPSISDDSQLLFFASDIFGGYGGSDLYLCYLKDGSWSEVFNLGPGVNTAGNEFFPFIAHDKTLYFSSDGRGGVGGYDVFSATPVEGVYKNVKNLGFGVNSGKDDVAVFLDSTNMRGYVSSNRVGGKGLFDIYYFENKQIPIVISGVAKDFATKQVLPEIQIELQNENGDITGSTKTDIEGKFIFSSFKQTGLVLRASSEMCEMLEGKLDLQLLKKDDELVLNIFLNKK